MVPTVAMTIAASVRSIGVGAHPVLLVGRHLAQLHAEHARTLVGRGVRVLGADTTTLRPVVWRAAIIAVMVEVEAASSMWPCQPSGRPSSCATQSHTSPSSSVDAGEVRHRIATGFSAAASSSARIPGRDAVRPRSRRSSAGAASA